MSDSLAMTARGLRLSVRKPDALITGLTLPPMILLVFVYLFGGAVNTGTRYVTYVVPGILILGAFLSSAATAVTVCQDMTGGIIDRFRSMNVPGTAIIGGHVLASTARYAIAAVLMLAVGYGIGFRAHAEPEALAEGQGRKIGGGCRLLAGGWRNVAPVRGMSFVPCALEGGQ